MFLKLLVVYFILKNTYCDKELLNIGAIFEEPHLDEIFRYAVDRVNTDPGFNIRLNLVSIEIYPDAFAALTRTCQLVHEGVAGIFGPVSTASVNIVHAICDATDIPHILTNWVNSDEIGIGNSHVNFFPHPNLLMDAYVDIINNLEWGEVTVLYVDPESIKNLAYFIERGSQSGLIVNVVHLMPLHEGNYRLTLMNLRDLEHRNFMIYCQIADLEDVLQNLLHVGMFTENYNYLLTNLDASSSELEIFSYGKAHITGVELVNPEGAPYSVDPQANNRRLAKTETSLIIDAVYTFATVLKSLNVTETIALDCNVRRPWKDGQRIVSSLKSVSNTGLTGSIKFDSFGYRNEFELYIFDVTEGERKYVGSWNTSNGLSVESSMDYEESDALTVITTLTEPYTRLKVGTETSYGNDRYEGFAVDLISELSDYCNFNYTLVIREDMQVGHFDTGNQQWTGMIGDILEERADLAIGDVTITSLREEAVDFTIPFLMTGISILYKKPVAEPKEYFIFTDTFSCSLWGAILVSGFLVSFVLLVLGRISSREWHNPCPHNKEPEYLTNELTFMNCLWFIIGSVMRQCYNIKLRSVATRAVAALWWFFTVLIVSLYVAKLVATMINGTTDIKRPDFENLEELIKVASDKAIKFGAKSGGATEQFFRNQAEENPDSAYAKAWDFMKNNDIMVRSNEEGVERASNERYALFMESSSLEYVAQHRCYLQQVGPLLDSKGYGIALRKNSTIRNCLSTGILRLEHSGKIGELRRKWWRRNSPCIDYEYEDPMPIPLELHDLAGVFAITFIGILLAFLLAIFEATVHTIRRAAKTKIPLSRALLDDIKFYFSFTRNTKRLVDKQHSSIPLVEGSSRSRPE